MHKPAIALRNTPLVGIDIEAVRRGQIRWLCLEQLDRIRPDVMTELALLAIIQVVYPNASHIELRRELDYLKLCTLLTISSKLDMWHLTLTYQGIDVVEYTSECPDGIGRPT